jgi:hypothetical protein
MERNMPIPKSLGTHRQQPLSPPPSVRNLGKSLHAHPLDPVESHQWPALYGRSAASGELVLRNRWISACSGRECGPDDQRDWATLAEALGVWQRWSDLFDGVAIAIGQIRDGGDAP